MTDEQAMAARLRAEQIVDRYVHAVPELSVLKDALAGAIEDAMRAHVASLQRQNADLSLTHAAASKFIRGVIDALGKEQPTPKGTLDLIDLQAQLVGRFDEQKVDAETWHANFLVENELRLSAEQEVASLQREQERLQAELDKVAPWTCPICGPHVKVDEDGCCVHCGADAALQSVPPQPQKEMKCN